MIGLRIRIYEKDWRECIVYTRVEFIDSETGEILRELGDTSANVASKNKVSERPRTRVTDRSRPPKRASTTKTIN